MRDKLAPYLSQYVLCKGWIDDWEKIEDENYRVLIKQTTITAIPKPKAASIFLDIAINVHIPRNKDNAIFSINTVVINIFR